MATITVRDLPDAVRDALKARARRHGRSMEAEARALLSAAVADVFFPPVEVDVDPAVWEQATPLPSPPEPGRMRLSDLPPHRLRTASSIEDLIEDEKGAW
jgi:hypothetical protein